MEARMHVPKSRNRGGGQLVLPAMGVQGHAVPGSPDHWRPVKHTDSWVLDQPTCIRTHQALGICIFKKWARLAEGKPAGSGGGAWKCLAQQAQHGRL